MAGMDFMTWALDTATKHPGLSTAIVNANGDWLDILLADGRSFRFRPGALINPDADVDAREDILNRLITIGIDQSTTVEEARPDVVTQPAAVTEADDANATDDAPLIPIVRSASYFLASHRGGDSIVYLPLTDFVAVGAARDNKPLYYSQLGGDMREIGDIMTEAVVNLRSASGGGAVVAEGRFEGARTLALSRPENYGSSWFADVDMIQQINDDLAKKNPDGIPLFVPASREVLYVVFSNDPHLVDFFRRMAKLVDNPETVYPLPHTVAADGWREWIPFPGDELADVLGRVRTSVQSKIYADQVAAMSTWNDFGSLKDYRARTLKTGEHVSATEWDASDRSGSIPVTDFITFTRQASPHPWETAPAVSITVRTHVAIELWSEGMTVDEDAWPPRYNVAGFPDDETLIKLRDAAGRTF